MFGVERDEIFELCMYRLPTNSTHLTQVISVMYRSLITVQGLDINVQNVI